MPGGEFNDVVGGDTATAARQNEMQHRVVNHFTSTAERDSLWPAPPDGAVCYLADLEVLQLFHSAVWNDVADVASLTALFVNVTGDSMSGDLIMADSLVRLLNDQNIPTGFLSALPGPSRRVFRVGAEADDTSGQYLQFIGPNDTSPEQVALRMGGAVQVWDITNTIFNVNVDTTNVQKIVGNAGVSFADWQMRNVWVGATPPAGAQVGALWFDTSA